VSKARLIITAVVLEGRSQAQVARDYNVSPAWVSRLVARYRTEGDTAFEPRSRRPHTRPDATATVTVDLILELRRRLTAAGLDAGADTICWHLEHHHHIHLSRATVYRIVRRAGTCHPRTRQETALVLHPVPGRATQRDLAGRLHPPPPRDGSDVEILTWLDDHSRYALSVTAHHPSPDPIVVTTFRAAIEVHGIPFSTLTDNGLVFTTRFAHGGRTSRNGFENELTQLGVRQKNSRPNHPTTCGKVERFQQTMKRWLRTQPAAATLAELQTQLDAFVEHLQPPSTPPLAPASHDPSRRLHHPPQSHTRATTDPDTEFRVRHDRIRDGNVSLRVDGQLHHIGLGRTLDRTPIVMLITGYDVRVIHATTGEIIRALTIDPERRYHGTGNPRNPPRPSRKTQRPEP
jgi:transposase